MKIFTDGGSRGNPGRSASAFVVYEDEMVVYEAGRYLGIKTNNEAEYQGVIDSLEWLEGLVNLPESVIWYLDSKLVVEQIMGRWKIKEARLKALSGECKQRLSGLFPQGTYDFCHVPRVKNMRADNLVNETLDRHES